MPPAAAVQSPAPPSVQPSAAATPAQGNGKPITLTFQAALAKLQASTELFYGPDGVRKPTSTLRGPLALG